MSKSSIAASGVALALILAACGGGPSGTPAVTAPTGPGATPTDRPADGPAGSESDLEAAARALFEAFKEDDDEAYFLGLSLACRSSAGFGIVSERNNSRHARIGQAGMDILAIEITDVTIGAFDGHSATVALTLFGTDGNAFLENEPNPWVFEDGGWHWDNCDPFETGGGGGGGLEGSGPNDAIAVGLVPTIADWYVYSSYLLPDADELVTGEGAPAPPPGTVYFMWEVVAQYNGPNASQALADALAFRLVAGNTTYDDPSGCPDAFALDLGLVAAPGEQARGSLCQAIATGDVRSLFLIVTDKNTGRDYWFGQE
jgi:hypothetical protein